MKMGPPALLRFLRGRRFTVCVLSFAVAVLMLALYISRPPIMRFLEHKIYDTMLRAGADGQVTPSCPVIIDLDEEALKAYGQWPWPRFLVAALFEKLGEMGVASVGVDIIFSEADRSSPIRLREDLKRLDINAKLDEIPAEFQDYDQLLASFLHEGIVLGMYANFIASASPSGAVAGDGAFAPLPAPPSIGLIMQGGSDGEPSETQIIKARGATFPLPLFWDAAAVGMVNMNPDEDGVARGLPLICFYQGRLYAALSLRSLMASLGQRNLFLNFASGGLESIKVGKYTIPVGPDGRYTIPYKGGAHTFPYYSAKDILDDAVPAEKLAGRIAFLGTSAPGLMDIRVSPLDRVYPGVEVHASVLDSILAENFLLTPSWTPGAQALGIIICALIGGLCFGFAKPIVYAPAAGGLTGLILYFSMYFFRQGLVISPLYMLATLALLGVCLLVLRFWQEEKQKKMLRSAFSRYVAPEVVERIAGLEGDIFAGEEAPLSIMFTDIRGFTSISEKLSPRQIVSLLNRYFTPMTALVRGNLGTLDKFIGDALMAFWNAPVQVPDHPRRAVLTALAMQDTLREMNGSLREEFGITLNIGVGVHSGTAYVGNMGSEDLLNYTLIGDNVNLASRLEGLCPQFGVGIVVSAQTRAGCGDEIAFQPLDLLRVKGKEQPVSVFCAMRPEEWTQRAEELEEYISARDAYAVGNFASAGRIFGALAKTYPQSKLYALYAARCAALVHNPPAEWDGVWTLKSK
ncbi:MAG: adenylate/guanylate cyclase domain-containing protein [Desulfovibrio sp.]|jgi:adenylate cyclase|nr:adenylate/guanylate cyclase domain-containing protein [Desulfovibrio sp.]